MYFITEGRWSIPLRGAARCRAVGSGAVKRAAGDEVTEGGGGRRAGRACRARSYLVLAKDDAPRLVEVARGVGGIPRDQPTPDNRMTEQDSYQLKSLSSARCA